MTEGALFGGPIVTGEAVAVDLRPAGAGSRGIAFFVDYAAQVGLTMLFLLIAGNLFPNMEFAGAMALVLVFTVLIWLGYPVLLETLWRGKTLGKAVMGLRVVRDDGGPIRFRHAFVRGLVGVVVDRPGISLGLLALIPMLVNARSKRLGDFAAGTVVVQERIPSRVSAPPPMPPQLKAWASTLDLSGVGDQLALELRAFLGRNRELAPWALAEMGNRLLGELSARVGPPPPGVPPWAYFAAVLAERRDRELARASVAPDPLPAPAPAASPPRSSPPPAAPPPGPPDDGPFAAPR